MVEIQPVVAPPEGDPPEIEPLDEESVFISDLERQWDFENNAKENLIWDLLNPRFALAEDMKESAERKVQDISQFLDEILQLFELGETDAIKQRIIDNVQDDNNPHSWLQGPE